MKRYLKLFSAAVIFIVLISSVSSAEDKEQPRKCIMVFGAHADDIEVMAGGTFAKYTIGENYEGICVMMSNNSCCGFTGRAQPGLGNPPLIKETGSPKFYPIDGLESIQIRTEEAKQAAAEYGAKIVFLNYREETIFIGRSRVWFGTKEFLKYNPPGRQIVSIASSIGEYIDEVIEMFKTYRPEITIIHTLGGEKQSHSNCGYLVYKAFKAAAAKGIPVGKLWMRAEKRRGFWLLDPDAQEYGRGKHDVRIDITDYVKIKREATLKHVSQNLENYIEELDKLIKDIEQGHRCYEEFITVFDYTKNSNKSVEK